MSLYGGNGDSTYVAGRNRARSVQVMTPNQLSYHKLGRTEKQGTRRIVRRFWSGDHLEDRTDDPGGELFLADSRLLALGAFATRHRKNLLEDLLSDHLRRYAT